MAGTIMLPFQTEHYICIEAVKIYDKCKIKGNIYHLVTVTGQLFFGLVYHWIGAPASCLNGFWHNLFCGHHLWVGAELLVSVYMFWQAVFLLRMVKPSWVLLSSCVRGLTLNVEVIMMVLMESVTWTALQKMATALTLWTQQGRTGEIPQSCTLYKLQITTAASSHFSDL